MSKSTYIVDLTPTSFTHLIPGEAIRLLPFGNVTKDGKTRIITPDYARKFKLPPWKPAIKLGSHEDETPAGAYINELDVRGDGLYALIDVTEKGAKAIEDGDYRYHSPEIIWDNGYLEDSEGGEDIQGPLILGDALLHNPHLGERAALFEIDKLEKPMTTEVKLPDKFWETGVEKLRSLFPDKPPPDEKEKADPEKLTAAIKERDDLKTEIDDMKAETAAKEQHAAIVAEFDTKEFGAAFIELGQAENAAKMLARMDEEVRTWVMTQFKAMSAQIKEGGLMDELGHNTDVDDNPVTVFNMAIEAIQKEKDVDYNEAYVIAKTKHAELFKAYTENK